MLLNGPVGHKATASGSEGVLATESKFVVNVSISCRKDNQMTNKEAQNECKKT